MGPAPDLQATVDSVTVNGSSLTIGYTVTNQGGGNAGAAKLDFFVDPAAAPAVGQTGDLRVDIPALVIGGTYSGTAVVSGVSGNSSILYALVDSTGVVAESNETNNLTTSVNLDAPPVEQASSDVPLTIASLSSVTSNLYVSGAADSIRYLAVDLGITHPFDEDLVITLISPAGTAVILSNRRGGEGHNYTGTVFHDGAGASITAGTAPFTAEFRPEQPLAVLLGENPNGTWQLKIEDKNARG